METILICIIGYLYIIGFFMYAFIMVPRDINYSIFKNIFYPITFWMNYENYSDNN